MSSLELKVPPLVVVLAIAAAMWFGSGYVPALHLELPFGRIFALALASAGFIVCTLGFLEFRKAKTTLNPTKPQSSSSLVTAGIYRRTRNPMYLGFLLLLSGWAVATANLAAFVGLPAFVVYMNRFQIRPEERALRTIFGADFTVYAARVRRWI